MTTMETRGQIEATSDVLPGMSMRTVWWFMAIPFGLGVQASSGGRGLMCRS